MSERDRSGVGFAPGHPLRASTIAHRNLTILGPMTGSELEHLLDAAAPVSPGRAIDIGCGKGDLLIRLARRGLRGTGVDRNPVFLGEAAALAVRAGVADRIELVTAVATEVEADLAAGAGFDLVACIGATQALGGPEEAPARLGRLARPGGAVLIGEGYWRREPTEAELASFGMEPGEMVGWDETLGRMTASGLGAETTIDASLAGWDAYEAAYADALEAWAAANPDDPDAGRLRAQASEFRDTWRDWRREAMGFVTAVLRAPAALDSRR